MKNSRKVILATLLAFVMLFSSFAVLNVGAISNDVDVPIANLYYFNDYYPTVPKSQLNEDYHEINSTYDHKWIDFDGFHSLVYNNYFESIADGTIVVIDIKSFMPSTNDLFDLFFSLKDKDCMTIFVTVYDEDDFEDTSFMAFVDQYVKSEYQRLRSFLNLYLQRIAFLNQSSSPLISSPFDNAAFLIDGRLLDFDENFGFDFDNTCTNSPFFRLLLEEFAGYIAGGSNMSYAEIFNTLIQDMDILFFAHAGANKYVNLSSGELFEVENFEEFYSETTAPWDYICALGFSQLDSDFYDFLVQGQNFLRELTSSNIQVGILEVEPFTLGFPQLNFFTLPQLIGWCNEEPYKEWDSFYEALDEVLQELLAQ